jgi:hypothetical protein
VPKKPRSAPNAEAKGNQLSRANLRQSQCGSLRDELNSRSTWRFSARMTPMRANIVGPPDVAAV